MKRYIKQPDTKTIDEIENDLWNAFYMNRDRVLAYGGEYSPTGQNSYINTFTIEYTDSGIKLFRNSMNRNADYQEIKDTIAAGFYSVAKAISKIQPDLNRWEDV